MICRPRSRNSAPRCATAGHGGRAPDLFEVGAPGLHHGVGQGVAGGEVEDERVEHERWGLLEQ